MPCPHCNAPANAADRFCVTCGQPLTATDDLAPAATAAANRLPAVPWRGGQVAMSLLIVVSAFLTISSLSLLLEPLDSGLAWAAWIASHAIGIVILLVVWLLGNDRRRVSLTALAAALGLGLSRPRLSWLYALLLTALALGLSIGLTALYGWAITLLSEQLLPLPDRVKQLLLPPELGAEILFPGPAALLTFEALAGWTSFTEELFFRGFVFAGLIPRWGIKGAAVGSALIFSAFHLYPGVLLPIFVTGLLLAGLYRLTGSLWPPILAHAGQNALALLSITYAP